MLDKPLHHILQEVSTYFEVTPNQIKGKSRKQPLPDARHLFIVEAYKQGYSITFITRYINCSHAMYKHAKYKSTCDNTFQKILKNYSNN